MHKVHGSCINGNVCRAERSDGCGGGIEADEMHGDITVVAERCGDREAGGERAAEGVDKHVDLLAVVLGKCPVNFGAVEVLAPNVAFESDVVCCLGHGCDVLHRKTTAINREGKRHSVSEKMSNFAL